MSPDDRLILTVNLILITVEFYQVRLAIKQENFYILFFTKLQIVILTLHNSKTTCDRQKPIVYNWNLHRK